MAARATTIQTSPSGFTPTGTARVSGTKLAGSAVSVTLTNSGAVLCTVPADQSTSWSCGTVTLPDGSRLRLEAQEAPTDESSIPASGSVIVDSLAPPTLDGPANQLTTGIVSGSGNPGSRVRVSVDGAVDASCAAVPVGSDASWSCNLQAASGTPRTVRAQQSNSAIGSGALTGFSNALIVTIDREPAPAPVISSPVSTDPLSGATAVVATGSGEDSASIDVYIDNVPACSTLVAGTTWSCSLGTLLPGPHVLQAIQRDEAGNFSSPSAPVTVTVQTSAVSAPATPAPGQSATPSPTPKPEGATPTPKPTPATPQSPGSTPAPTPSEGTAPPGAQAAPPGAPPAANWNAPTDFGATLTSFTNPASFSSWYTAPLAALVFLALFALPLRLLVTALRDRIPTRRPHLTGRNTRPHRDLADAETVPRPLWRRMALPIAATALLVIFTGGIDGEVRYARLLIAVAIGLTVLNLVGAALGARLGAQVSSQPTTLRFVPLMFVAAAATAVLSRMFGIDPPLIAGVLLAPAFAMGIAVRARAIVNIVQIGSILVVGTLGWIGHGALAASGAIATPAGTQLGFWPAIASESLATLCLAGLGSALVMVLPIASLPGRVILEWSPVAWVATVLVVASVAAAITTSAAVAASGIPLLFAALGFAAVSLAIWAWIRFVEPLTA